MDAYLARSSTGLQVKAYATLLATSVVLALTGVVTVLHWLAFSNVLSLLAGEFVLVHAAFALAVALAARTKVGLAHVAVVLICICYAYVLATQWQSVVAAEQSGVLVDWSLALWVPMLIFVGPVVAGGLLLAAALLILHMISEIRLWYL